jgi:hypothetical protein
MFTRMLEDKYDHSIADQTEIDALISFDDNEDKLVFRLHSRISRLHLLNQ